MQEARSPNKDIKEIVDSTAGDNLRMAQHLTDDALKFIDGAREKLELYPAHRVRVANQQREIDAIHRELERGCLESKKDRERGIVVAVWKVKFNPMSARETTQEHFGKRGNGWHGCLFYYYKYEEDEVEGPGGVLQKVGKAVCYNVYVRPNLGGFRQAG